MGVCRAACLAPSAGPVVVVVVCGVLVVVVVRVIVLAGCARRGDAERTKLDLEAVRAGGHDHHEGADVTADVEQHRSLTGIRVLRGSAHGGLLLRCLVRTDVVSGRDGDRLVDPAAAATLSGRGSPGHGLVPAGRVAEVGEHVQVGRVRVGGAVVSPQVAASGVKRRVDQRDGRPGDGPQLDGHDVVDHPAAVREAGCVTGDQPDRVGVGSSAGPPR